MPRGAPTLGRSYVARFLRFLREFSASASYIGAMTCEECSGSRAIPDIFGDYGPCPSCVIDAGETFVVLE
jgi:hypothetical protein